MKYLDAAGKTVSVREEDVAAILFSDTPSNLAKANVAAGENKFDKAFTLFQEALNEIGTGAGKAREFHKQYILHDWAMALQARGDIRQSLDMFERLRKECGDCRLRGESYRKGLELARKKLPDHVDVILKEQKNEPEPLGGQAALELARVLYEKNEFDAANAEFSKLGEKVAAPYAPEARLWSLRCLRALKKLDEFESAAIRILGDRGSATPALVQCAGSGLSEALLIKSAKDKTKVREALMAATQAIAIGPPAAKESPEDYLIALLNAAKCYQIMANDLQKPESKTDYKNRAISYCMEVSRLYKDTRWASVAQKELSALGHDEKAPKDSNPSK